MTLLSNSSFQLQQLRVTGRAIKLWLALLLLTASSLACRLEVGLEPASAAQGQPEVSAAVILPPPADNQTGSEATNAQPEPTGVSPVPPVDPFLLW